MFTETTPEQEAALDETFTYHPASEDQRIAYEALRQSAKDFARCILQFTPRCADQSAAVRLVRQAIMTANAAVAIQVGKGL